MIKKVEIDGDVYDIDYPDDRAEEKFQVMVLLLCISIPIVIPTVLGILYVLVVGGTTGFAKYHF